MKNWFSIGSAMASVMAMVSVATAAPMSVKSKTVDYKIGDESFEGLFVYPQTKGKVPGVLMVHNWLGVTDETKRQAERVAKLGLAVFAVDVYGKGIRAKGPQDAVRLSGTYKNDRKLFRTRVLRGSKFCASRRKSIPARSSRPATASAERASLS
jgi:dienelactone hydrolase